ncbi:phage protein NinX family protein [Serratia sp. IR-2025]
MTDYSKMSDKEINHSVLAIFEPDIEHMMLGVDETHFYHCGITGDGYHQIDIPDYCNNPADAWPIIVENEICIEFESDEVEGVRQVWAEANIGHPACNGFQYFSDENPLRAAMIVFLMMKDAEKC